MAIQCEKELNDVTKKADRFYNEMFRLSKILELDLTENQHAEIDKKLGAITHEYYKLLCIIEMYKIQNPSKVYHKGEYWK